MKKTVSKGNEHPVCGQNNNGNNDMDWNNVGKSLNEKKTSTKSKPNDSDGTKNDKLLDDLSSSFIEQQNSNANLRKSLTIWFILTTAIQLIVIDVIIFLGIFNFIESVALFDFLRFFISATFIELLGGLIIIVKFVFKDAIYDMLKHLTYHEPSPEE